LQGSKNRFSFIPLNLSRKSFYCSFKNLRVLNCAKEAVVLHSAAYCCQLFVNCEYVCDSCPFSVAFCACFAVDSAAPSKKENKDQAISVA
jgi:hypothetical protein